MSSVTKAERRAEKKRRREETRTVDPDAQAVLDFLRLEFGDFARLSILSRPRTVVDLVCGEFDYDIDAVFLGVSQNIYPVTPLEEVAKIIVAAAREAVYEAPELDVIEDPSSEAAQEDEDNEVEEDADLGGTDDGLDALTADQLRKLNTSLGNPVKGARVLKKHTLVERLREAGIRVNG